MRTTSKKLIDKAYCKWQNAPNISKQKAKKLYVGFLYFKKYMLSLLVCKLLSTTPYRQWQPVIGF